MVKAPGSADPPEETPPADPPEGNPPEPQFATKEEIAACQAEMTTTRNSLADLVTRLDSMSQDDPRVEALGKKLQRTRHSLAEQTAALRKLRLPKNGKEGGRKEDPGDPDPPKPRTTHLGLPVL